MKTPENTAFVFLNAEDFPAFNETEKMIDPGKQNKEAGESRWRCFDVWVEAFALKVAEAEMSHGP